MEQEHSATEKILTRTERKQLQHKTKHHGFSKKSISVTVAIFIVIMFFVGMISYKLGQINDDARFTSTVSSNLSFDKQVFPDGWDDKLSDRDKGTQFSERNPLPATFEGCSYNRITTFLPSDKVGKGGEYLSKNLAYEYAESLGELDPATSVQKIKVNGKKTGAIEAAWGTTMIRVRVFDSFSPQPVPEDLKEVPPRGVATVTTEGVPAVILEYSCGEKGNFNPELGKEMFESSNIIS